MKVLISIIIVLLLLVLYAFWLRPWMKTKSWAQGFFALVEPIELVLFKKSETILFARIKILTGIVLTLLTQVGTLDISPLMPFVPDQYEGMLRAVFNLLPLLITVVGWMDESLRKATTKPLELVALPEAAKDQPEVAAAVAQADGAKELAVAVVKDKVI